jgi:hypothetical protein
MDSLQMVLGMGEIFVALAQDNLLFVPGRLCF